MLLNILAKKMKPRRGMSIFPSFKSYDYFSKGNGYFTNSSSLTARQELTRQVIKKNCF